MQVTGESLERALAALMGQTAGSAPEAEDDAPQSEEVPEHEDTPRLEDVSLREDVQRPTEDGQRLIEDVRETDEDSAAPAQERDQERPTPGVGRKRPSRSHLRGL